MFTGIVTTVGRVDSIIDLGGDARIEVDVGDCAPSRLADGASIAINGVCLTVTSRRGTVTAFDVSRETLGRTTLGRLAAGARVNVEPALSLQDSLGGHLVAGHVDAVGTVAALAADARSVRMEFSVPPGLMRYVAEKGSICVDGVSLTVNVVTAGTAAVNVVPHTLDRTIMGSYRPGTPVNLEVDLVARYLERLVGQRS
ncbi:MAG: riboflavin synthase [Gammaproteobacteria bacterium]|nr:riboflavin synthase [Gammaproteobacteria bacterium]